MTINRDLVSVFSFLSPEKLRLRLPPSLLVYILVRVAFLLAQIIKALGLTLKKLPSINGRLVMGRYYEAMTADIGCLVAIDTPKVFFAFLFFYWYFFLI